MIRALLALAAFTLGACANPDPPSARQITVAINKDANSGSKDVSARFFGVRDIECKPRSSGCFDCEFAVEALISFKGVPLPPEPPEQRADRFCRKGEEWTVAAN